MQTKLRLIEFVVLEALRRQGNQYGWQILTSAKGFLENPVSLGAIYQNLRRLEGRKLIKGKWEKGQNSGGGRRRFYSLTISGKKTIQKMREVLTRMLAE